MSNPIEFDKTEIEKSIVARFEKIANLYPNQIAINTGEQVLTYQELNQLSNQLARAIITERGVGQEPVLLLFEQGIDVLISILAVLKAGKIYTVIDPSFPEARLNQILANAQAQLILTTQDFLSLAHHLTRQDSVKDALLVININSLDDFPTHNLEIAITPKHLAAIFYTSGSTGQPKGVMRSHRILLHNAWILNQRIPNLSFQDRFALTDYCGNGGSASPIFGAWFRGIPVYPFDLKKLGLSVLVRFLIEHEITYFRCPSPVFQQFVEGLAESVYFPKLRFLTVGSDKLFKKTIDKLWQHCSPECILQHLYGSTESGFISEFLINSNTLISSNIISVGKVVPDKQVFILDEHGNHLEPQQIGEIAVESRYLSSGYWRNPELTHPKFLPSRDRKQLYLTGDLGKFDENGTLYHLGRKDAMVKIRGHRIEILEIESILSSLPEIERAIVIVQSPVEGEAHLIAYLVSKQTPPPSNQYLREQLTHKLPDYFLPSAFIILDQFPLTATGKINRLALPLPSPTRPELDYAYIPAQSSIEAALVEIWQKVLNINPIGINDKFLDLGGNSLQAMQIINRIAEKIQLSISLRALFECNTIAEMAKILASSSSKISTQSNQGTTVTIL